MKYSICVADHAATEVWPQQYMTWDELVGWLDLDNPRAKKDGRCYVCAELIDSTRTAATVASRSVAVIDADHVTAEFPDQAKTTLAGVAHVGHSTYRHMTADHGSRYRLLIPLSRSVSPAEYVLITGALAAELGDGIDAGSLQPERLMYTPSATNPDEYMWWVEGGEPLDVEEWLACASAHGLDADPSDASGPAVADFVAGDPTDAEIDKAEAVLAKAERNVEAMTGWSEFEDVGGASNSLIVHLPVLLQFVLGGCLDEADVVERLWDAACRTEARTGVPKVRRVYDNTVASAWRYAHQRGPARPTIVDETATGWEKVFSASSRLQHIQQAAHAGAAPATMLLGAVLARMALEIPIRMVLPGTEDGSTGSRQGLNFGVVMSSDSGGGKSTSESASASLLGLVGAEQRHLTRVPKTGPGLVEEFMTMVPVEEDKRKHRKVLVADPRRFFFEDEIKRMFPPADNGNRGPDQELLADLCKMLMGGTVGQSLADASKSRMLESGTYRMSMLLGAQTLNTRTLLLDDASGTPQRFVFFGDDASIQQYATADELPEYPGELGWDDTFLDKYAVDTHVIPVADHIKAAVVQARLEASQGKRPQSESHDNLQRLKVAVLLAALHEEVGITDRWWDLAGVIIDLSNAEKRRCLSVISEASRQQRIKGKVQDADATQAAEEQMAVKSEKKQRIKSQILEKLASMGDGTPSGKIRKKIRAGDRNTFDEVLGLMESLGEIRVERRMERGAEVMRLSLPTEDQA